MARDLTPRKASAMRGGADSPAQIYSLLQNAITTAVHKLGEAAR
jgi:hypothetical protein